MQITASMVNALREKTGVGMMQCKKALTETEGDMEKAVELLRKQGAAVAAKRADKEAKEGSVFLGETAGKVVAFELSCETDFVAGGDDFKLLGSDILNALLQNNITTTEELLQVKVGAISIADRIADVLAKIGENISVRKLAVVSVASNEAVATYSHMGGKIGVVAKIAFEGTPKDASALKAIAKDIAMQVAAFSPVAINEAGVNPEVIAKEREIALEQIKNEGKTKPDFMERAVEGRVKKVLKEICLEDQEFFKDSKQQVKSYLKAAATEQGLESITVSQFVRFERGK